MYHLSPLPSGFYQCSAICLGVSYLVLSPCVLGLAAAVAVYLGAQLLLGSLIP